MLFRSKVKREGGVLKGPFSATRTSRLTWIAGRSGRFGNGEEESFEIRSQVIGYDWTDLLCRNARSGKSLRSRACVPVLSHVPCQHELPCRGAVNVDDNVRLCDRSPWRSAQSSVSKPCFPVECVPYKRSAGLSPTGYAGSVPGGRGVSISGMRGVRSHPRRSPSTSFSETRRSGCPSIP